MEYNGKYLKIPAEGVFKQSLQTGHEYALMKEDDIGTSKALLKIVTESEHADSLYSILVQYCVYICFYGYYLVIVVGW